MLVLLRCLLRRHVKTCDGVCQKTPGGKHHEWRHDLVLVGAQNVKPCLLREDVLEVLLLRHAQSRGSCQQLLVRRRRARRQSAPKSEAKGTECASKSVVYTAMLPTPAAE